MKRGLPALFVFLLVIGIPAKVSAVKINEFLANGSPEWVEFYNDDLSNEVLMTYWLDDDVIFEETDETGSAKLQLTGLNTTNPTFPFITMNTMLNNGGDNVVLFDAGGNVVDQYTYTANPGAGVSIGRNPDGDGNFEILAQTSQGAANFPSPTGEPSPTPTVEPTATPSETPTATPTLQPTPTDIPPTPTNTPVPDPTSTPSPTLVPPTPTPTLGAPADVVIDATIMICRIRYTGKAFWGMTIWWPRLTCEKVMKT